MGANIDRLAVAAAFAQAQHDGTFDDDLADYLSLVSARRKVLLFAFAPKAAGTFLRSAAIEAVRGQLVRITHAQGGRDAQPYLPTLLNYYLGGLCEGPLVAHLHMQGLPANRHFLEALEIRPLIMLRSITDMLASYCDMLDSDPQARAEGLNCTIPDGFADFGLPRKSEFMLDMIAPWYVSYFATWLDCAQENPGSVGVLRYADFVRDPSGVLETALDLAGLPRSRAICDAAIVRNWNDRKNLRFNKAISGRGQDYFSTAQRARLATMLSYHPVLAGYAAELL